MISWRMSAIAALACLTRERISSTLADSGDHRPRTAGRALSRLYSACDAVAAGVQNLLLGATAAGLASYWGTGAVTGLEDVKRLCRFDPQDTIVALIYLGWPIGDVPVPQRPPADVHFIS